MEWDNRNPVIFTLLKVIDIKTKILTMVSWIMKSARFKTNITLRKCDRWCQSMSYVSFVRHTQNRWYLAHVNKLELMSIVIYECGLRTCAQQRCWECCLDICLTTGLQRSICVVNRHNDNDHVRNHETDALSGDHYARRRVKPRQVCKTQNVHLCDRKLQRWCEVRNHGNVSRTDCKARPIYLGYPRSPEG